MTKESQSQSEVTSQEANKGGTNQQIGSQKEKQKNGK